MKLGEAQVGQRVFVLGRNAATIDKVNPNGTVWLTAEDEDYNGLWAPQWFTAHPDANWSPSTA